MEVYEEEEIKEMKEKRRYFEEIRNRELMEVQRLEEKEKRRNQEILRRINQEKERKEIDTLHHKKMLSRHLAKQLISVKLKTNVLNSLKVEGLLDDNLRYRMAMTVVPNLMKQSENKLIEVAKFVSNFNSLNLNRLFRNQNESI